MGWLTDFLDRLIALKKNDPVTYVQLVSHSVLAGFAIGLLFGMVGTLIVLGVI